MENKIKIIKPDNQHRSVSMEGIERFSKTTSIKGAEPKCFMGQSFQSFGAHIILTLVQLLLMVGKKNAKCHNLLYKSGAQKWQR